MGSLCYKNKCEFLLELDVEEYKIMHESLSSGTFQLRSPKKKRI